MSEKSLIYFGAQSWWAKTHPWHTLSACMGTSAVQGTWKLIFPIWGRPAGLRHRVPAGKGLHGPVSSAPHCTRAGLEGCFFFFTTSFRQ